MHLNRILLVFTLHSSLHINIWEWPISCWSRGHKDPIRPERFTYYVGKFCDNNSYEDIVIVLVVWLMTQYLQLHTILSFICRDCILRRSGKHFPWRIYFYSKIVKYETSVFSPLVGRYYTLVVAANERRWRRVRNQLKVVADSFKLLDIWEWCSLRAHDFQQQYGSGARLFLLWLIVSMFQVFYVKLKIFLVHPCYVSYFSVLYV